MFYSSVTHRYWYISLILKHPKYLVCKSSWWHHWNYVFLCIACGEPPLCMSCSVLFALKHAIQAARLDAGNTDFFQLSKFSYHLEGFECLNTVTKHNKLQSLMILTYLVLISSIVTSAGSTGLTPKPYFFGYSWKNCVHLFRI